MKQEVITVLVPETDGRGRYRFKVSAFFETCKADYSRMLKALKADTENAADNARVLLESVQEAGPAYISAWDAAGRVKDLQNIAEGKQAEDRQQKQLNNMIELFCSKGKKAKMRPILSRPFVSDGIVYACDAFTAVKIENPSCYTGEVLPELNEYGKTPEAGRFFGDLEAVKQNYKQITLPALSVLKEWGKAGKMPAEPDNAAAFKTENVCIFAPYVYRMAALTGSNILYINPEKPFSPVYMFSENFTVLALPYRPMGKQVDYIKTLPAVCLFTYNQETGPACLDCTEAETIHVASVKKYRKAKKTDKPADNVQEETKPEPAAVPMGKDFSNDESDRAASDFAKTVQNETGVILSDFAAFYSKRYKDLYNGTINEYTNEYREKVSYFDHYMTDEEKKIMRAFNQYRGDLLTSDREIKAFIDTLQHFQNMKAETELPADQEAPAADQEETEAPAEAGRDSSRVYKIAGIELTGETLEKAISNKQYLVKFRTVYGIKRTARGYAAIHVYKSNNYVPIIGRGFHMFMDAERLENMFYDFAGTFYPIEDQEEKQAGPAETDHAADIPEADGTGNRPADAFRTKAGPEDRTGSPAGPETDHAVIVQTEAGPEPAEKDAVIITEYRQIQEPKTYNAENRPKQAAEATKDGRPVKYPRHTENPAGTAQNRPIIKNPAGSQTDSPGTVKPCRHGIKQGTSAGPLPINRQETGPPEKYRHKNGTRAGPGSFLRPSALSAPSVTF